MEYQEHLNRTKEERISDFYQKYQEIISNTNDIEIDPTKIVPSRTSVKIKGGHETYTALNIYVSYLKNENKPTGYLINYDGGVFPYTVNTDEYENILKKIEKSSAETFEKFCVAQMQILASQTVEDVFKVMF